MIRRTILLFLLLSTTAPAAGQNLTEQVRAWFEAETDEEREAKLDAVQSAAPEREALERAVQDALVPTGPAKTGRFEVELETGKEAFHMAVYVPETYDHEKAWPVHLGFHCRGIDGTDYRNSWLSTLRKKRPILVCPTEPRGVWNYHWGDRVTTILAWLRDRYHVDSDRISVGGFSSGSDIAWLLGLGRPDRFHAIVARATGRPVPDFLRGGLHHHIIVIEGKEDTAYLRQGRRVIEVLKKLDISHDHHEHPGGHEAGMTANEWIVDRLFDHRRPERPERVAGFVTNPAWGRLYWLEVLDTNRKACVVDATRSGNRIEIDPGHAGAFRVYFDRTFDFSKAVEIRIDGRLRFSGKIEPTIGFFLNHVRETGDPGRAYWAAIDVDTSPSKEAVEEENPK